MTNHDFAHQHAELISQAEDILATAASGREQGLQDLPQKRLAFSRMVNAHCSIEIKLVNHTVAASTKPEQMHKLIRRFHDELLAWRADLMDINAQWPQQKVLADPQGFRAAFSGLEQRLKARVKWEERTFYPALWGQAARPDHSTQAVRLRVT